MQKQKTYTAGQKAYDACLTPKEDQNPPNRRQTCFGTKFDAK